MDRARFEEIAAEEFVKVPERFKSRLTNVALLVEDGAEGELLGLYQGVPLTERGEGYGALGTLPDTITLFYEPLLHEAEHLAHERTLESEEAVRVAIRETLWHEIGHQFGMSEEGVEHREGEGSNEFRQP
jgi:predicted Zn-dependent protease with MMP-like domain